MGERRLLRGQFEDECGHLATCSKVRVKGEGADSEMGVVSSHEDDSTLHSGISPAGQQWGIMYGHDFLPVASSGVESPVDVATCESDHRDLQRSGGGGGREARVKQLL